MNIIFGENTAALAREKYTVLELDTFKFIGLDQPVKTYAVLERIPLEEMSTLDKFQSLHSNLIVEYQKRNWDYCKDAIEKLTGQWHGELDTFYVELSDRIQLLKTQSLSDDWNGVIIRSS